MWAIFNYLITMPTYIQYFHETTYVEGSIPPNFDGPPKLVESCGNGALIRVDARLSDSNIKQIAEQEGKLRHYKAWQVLRGPDLREAKPNGPIVRL